MVHDVDFSARRDPQRAARFGMVATGRSYRMYQDLLLIELTVVAIRV
jgi:hypothetical protein